MTAVIGSYTVFEKRLLAAAYFVSNRTDNYAVTISEIREHFNFEIPDRFARIAFADIYARELSTGYLTEESLENHTIALTAAGIKEAEAIISGNESDISEFDIADHSVPAADRLVTLDHNSPEYQEISRELNNLKDALRLTNDAGESGDERDRLVDSLDAAIQLWSSSQLKILQIKVGVIMAVEDVGAALQKAGKAVGWSLIVELIKGYVKNKVGIEF